MATAESVIEDGAVQFVVRRKDPLPEGPDGASVPGDPAASGRHPFAPPEPALTVGELSPTHVAVLNKFPVVPHHLLIVTRRFVPQEAQLDSDDFAAAARCLEAIDGLVFYNSGRDAGASQPHKHLQLVPLPLYPGPWAAPIEALFDSWAASGNVSRLLQLPFRNAFSLVEPSLFDDPEQAADRLDELYAAQAAALGIIDEDAPRAANDEYLGTAPYNLLVTRRWMLAVPRSRERFGTISINALGFAGSLFVRDAEELQDLRDAGPMRALRAVAVPDRRPAPGPC